MTTATHLTPRMITRVKHAVAEMNYAQRRLFELKTGSPNNARTASRRHVDELESLFRAKAI